jgi:site-specific recombinase XerD
VQLVVVNDTPASAIPDRTEIQRALARGAHLTTVRDNLRHASISTTSIYLHSDEVKRAKQIREAFDAR